jgi:hypothetical protein
MAGMIEHQNDTSAGMSKVAIAWLITLVGSITMQDVALFVAAVYSVLQIYVLVRDKILNPPPPPRLTTMLQGDPDEQP